MIPENKFSTTPVVSEFITPRRLSDLQDFEYGGVDLNDTSNGSSSHLWESYYEDNWLCLKNDLVSHQLLNVENLTYVSFCFDQNLRPCVTYKTQDVVYLYWYDTSLSSFVTDPFGENIITPQLTMDDKREGFDDQSDIIFSYIKTGDLFYRTQRDRFTIENYVATVGEKVSIIQAGINKKLRFQFYCE